MKRLGSGKGDAQEIKKHPYFSDIDFEALINFKIPPPYKPYIVSFLFIIFYFLYSYLIILSFFF